MKLRIWNNSGQYWLGREAEILAEQLLKGDESRCNYQIVRTEQHIRNSSQDFYKTYKKDTFILNFIHTDGPVVRILAFQARGPGSIPGRCNLYDPSSILLQLMFNFSFITFFIMIISPHALMYRHC